MIDKKEETILGKKPGLNKLETYVLTHNIFITYLVLVFGDLNKAQFYKMPYWDSPHHELEVVMSFKYLKLFETNEQTEDYHIRKPNDEKFLFEIANKIQIYLGEKQILLKHLI